MLLRYLIQGRRFACPWLFSYRAYGALTRRATRGINNYPPATAGGTDLTPTFTIFHSPFTIYHSPRSYRFTIYDS
jgi:hypothetical protein